MELGEKLFGSKWFVSQAEKEAKRDRLPYSERIGQVVAIAGTLIVLAFFVIHQTRPTGFFTDEFGTGDSTFFYVMILVGLVPAFIRLLLGTRNAARPADAFSLALFFVGGLYFLLTWPFDFAYFADPFPHSLEFLIDWVSADLGKLLIGFGVVVSPFFSVFTYLSYVAVKRRMGQPQVSTQ
ncbi:MAG TPA: hypothetical protein VF374_00145 [Thermoplasmata archaeon]